MCGFDTSSTLKEKENVTSQIPHSNVHDIPPPIQPETTNINIIEVSTTPIPAPVPEPAPAPIVVPLPTTVPTIVPTPVPSENIILPTSVTNTTTEEMKIDPTSSPKINRTGSGSPITPTGKKPKRVSIAGGLMVSEVDQYGKTVSTAVAHQTAARPKVSKSLAHLPIQGSRNKLEEIDLGNSSSTKNQMTSIKRKSVMATSLGGINSPLT